MFGIDDPTAAVTLPAPEAAGTQGYWTEGNPGTGVPATLVRASFLNSVQSELIAILTAAGLTPSKTTYNQVMSALQLMYGTSRIGHTYVANDWVPLPGGLILQWGTFTVPGGGSLSVPFPVTFPGVLFTVLCADNGSGSVVASATSMITTGFTALTFNSSTGVAAAGSISWMALGR